MKHKSIVQLFTSFQKNKKLYIVLEFLPKGTLFDYCGKKTLKETEALKLFMPIVEAVNFMHKAKTLHRDIKPENILLDDYYNPKLCDFGFCAIFGDRRTICGTREYLAPEIARGKGQDEKVDIWCLGILLYEMLCKKTPFTANDVFGNFRLPRIKFKKGLSQEVKTLIASMLRLDSRKRPSAKEILDNSLFLDRKQVKLSYQQFKDQNSRLKSMQYQTRTKESDILKRPVSSQRRNVIHRPKSTRIIKTTNLSSNNYNNRNIYFPPSKNSNQNFHQKNYNIYSETLKNDKEIKKSVSYIPRKHDYNNISHQIKKNVINHQNLNYNRSYGDFGINSQKSIYNQNHYQKSYNNLNINFSYEIDNNIYRKNYENKIQTIHSHKQINYSNQKKNNVSYKNGNVTQYTNNNNFVYHNNKLASSYSKPNLHSYTNNKKIGKGSSQVYVRYFNR